MSLDGNLILYTIFHCVIGVVLAIGFEILHEYCHYFRAKQLGYDAKVDIIHACTTVNVTDDEDNMKIALAPYIIVLPIAITTLVVGILLLSLGLIIGSALTIVFHILMYTHEGVEEKVNENE